jgi:hypothetical protein
MTPSGIEPATFRLVAQCHRVPQLFNYSVYLHFTKPESPLPLSKQLVPILNQINPAHALPSYLLKAYFNIILTSKLRTPIWSLPFRFPYQNPVCIFLLSHISPPILLDFITLIIFGDDYTTRCSVAQFSRASCYFLFFPSVAQ